MKTIKLKELEVPVDAMAEVAVYSYDVDHRSRHVDHLRLVVF